MTPAPTISKRDRGWLRTIVTVVATSLATYGGVSAAPPRALTAGNEAMEARVAAAEAKVAVLEASLEASLPRIEAWLARIDARLDRVMDRPK